MECFMEWYNHFLDGSFVIYWNLGLQICKVCPEWVGSGLKAQPGTPELVAGFLAPEFSPAASQLCSRAGGWMQADKRKRHNRVWLCHTAASGFEPIS